MIIILSNVASEPEGRVHLIEHLGRDATCGQQFGRQCSTAKSTGWK